MNAQQATSISNNAFIANNFLMPAVSRQAQLQQTRSSRSPLSPHLRNGSENKMNFNVTGTALALRETESMFDDVNGSFVLENAGEGNPLEFINAEEKL
jgi:hypothetical protein